jgi:hypothetical protein
MGGLRLPTYERREMFKSTMIALWEKIQSQALRAIESTNFYGNLLTDRQKFYIIASIMVLFAMINSIAGVQLLGFLYIMNKLTPDEDSK